MSEHLIFKIESLKLISEHDDSVQVRHKQVVCLWRHGALRVKLLKNLLRLLLLMQLVRSLLSNLPSLVPLRKVSKATTQHDLNTGGLARPECIVEHTIIIVISFLHLVLQVLLVWRETVVARADQQLNDILPALNSTHKWRHTLLAPVKW